MIELDTPEQAERLAYRILEKLTHEVPDKDNTVLGDLTGAILDAARIIQEEDASKINPAYLDKDDPFLADGVIVNMLTFKTPGGYPPRGTHRQCVVGPTGHGKSRTMQQVIEALEREGCYIYTLDTKKE